MKKSFKFLSLIGVLGLALCSQAMAGQALSWNLSRDILKAGTKNPSGVWSFMKNDSADHNPAHYALLPTYNKPCIWNGAIGQWVSYCWEDSTTLVIVGVGGKTRAYIPTLHPNYYTFSIVRWKSPITGKVTVSGRFSLLDNSGVTGINWFIDNDTNTLAQGSLNTLLEGNTFLLQDVAVKKGESLYFIVDPKDATPYYDTTGLDLLITAQL